MTSSTHFAARPADAVRWCEYACATSAAICWKAGTCEAQPQTHRPDRTAELADIFHTLEGHRCLVVHFTELVEADGRACRGSWKVGACPWRWPVFEARHLTGRTARQLVAGAGVAHCVIVEDHGDELLTVIQCTGKHARCVRADAPSESLRPIRLQSMTPSASATVRPFGVFVLLAAWYVVWLHGQARMPDDAASKAQPNCTSTPTRPAASVHLKRTHQRQLVHVATELNRDLLRADAWSRQRVGASHPSKRVPTLTEAARCAQTSRCLSEGVMQTCRPQAIRRTGKPSSTHKEARTQARSHRHRLLLHDKKLAFSSRTPHSSAWSCFEMRVLAAAPATMLSSSPSIDNMRCKDLQYCVGRGSFEDSNSTACRCVRAAHRPSLRHRSNSAMHVLCARFEWHKSSLDLVMCTCPKTSSRTQSKCVVRVT